MVLIILHHSQEPIPEVPDIGVDAIFSRGSAALAPARDPLQEPPAVILTHQRAPRIPLTRIDAPLVVTGAHHGIVNRTVRMVGCAALGSGHERHRCLLQVIRVSAAEWRVAPARDPALLLGVADRKAVVVLCQAHQANCFGQTGWRLEFDQGNVVG